MCSRLLHHSNDVRYCITHFLFVLPYTSFKPTARAPWRWRRVVHYKTLVRSRSILVVAGSRKDRGTHQGVQQRSNLKMDFARSVLYRRSLENRAGRASFFALDNCGNVLWECRFNTGFPVQHFRDVIGSNCMHSYTKYEPMTS